MLYVIVGLYLVLSMRSHSVKVLSQPADLKILPVWVTTYCRPEPNTPGLDSASWAPTFANTRYKPTMQWEKIHSGLAD